MKWYRVVLIFLLIALLALAGTVYYYDHKLGYVCLGLRVQHKSFLNIRIFSIPHIHLSFSDSL